MLRLHEYRYLRPAHLAEALDLLHGREDAMPVAGGTDLVPNMKHRLWTPRLLVGLKGVEEMRGIRLEDAEGRPAAEDDGSARFLSIGAAATLAGTARDPRVRRLFPALAAAAGHVAGPQIRNQGTIGGNLCLDTRCTYYNQSLFWRQALGFCLKKDGEVCHVTKVGKKCVAAHSADTPPVLMALGAEAELASPEGVRRVPVEDFFVADGKWNTVRRPDELVVRVRVPLPPPRLRTAYRKLRQRNSVDFPLLSVALAAEVAEDGTVAAMSLVVSALGARPRVVSGLEKVAVGRPVGEVADAVAQQAFKQCHPLENLIVDPDWRRAMVPVYVRRAVEQVARGA
ncbi:MAG TPA: FAD binding domain-containing protein [Longimicrobiaceae bacterium]|nr:FAD binding domain-containing protein [Longimicrobiaceae bacterium]